MVCPEHAGSRGFRAIDGVRRRCDEDRGTGENSRHHPRVGIRLCGRMRAGARRDRALDRAHGPHQGIERGGFRRGGRTGCDHRAPAGSGPEQRSFLPARSSQPQRLQHRREYRDQCGRSALPEIRGDAPLRSRARSGAGRRHGGARRGADAQEQDGFRSGRAVHRIRRDARDRDRSNAASAAVAAVARGAFGELSRHAVGGRRGAGDLRAGPFAVRGRNRRPFHARGGAQARGRGNGDPPGGGAFACGDRRARGQRAGGGVRVDCLAQGGARGFGRERDDWRGMRPLVGAAPGIFRIAESDRTEKAQRGHRGAAREAGRAGRIRRATRAGL